MRRGTREKLESVWEKSKEKTLLTQDVRTAKYKYKGTFALWPSGAFKAAVV